MDPQSDIQDAIVDLRDAEQMLEVQQRVAGGHDRLLTVDEIEDMPLPAWLVKDVLIEGALAVLAGEPGVGKSFLALDWALSVASGVDWMGRPCANGPVAYVAAEGAGGLGPRVRAWRHWKDRHHELPAWFLARSLQLLDPSEADRFLSLLRLTLPAPPKLIVIDTLARCLVGVDENASQFVGQFIEAAALLQRKTGAACLILHHFTKNKPIERGSGALRGAADTLLFLRSTQDGPVELTCEKQKDHVPFQPIRLALKSYKDSCVIDEPLTLWSGQPAGDDPWND